VAAVEYEKAKSEANRLRGAVEEERIERDRNLNSLEGATRKLESQMKNSEVRAPIEGLLTNVQTIDGKLVSDGNELFTVSSHNNYVRGEVNEEDVGEVKPGLKAKLQLYAYRPELSLRALLPFNLRPIQPLSATPLCLRWKIPRTI